MARKPEVSLTAVMLALCGDPTAWFEERDDGRHSLNTGAGAGALSLSAATLRRLAA